MFLERPEGEGEYNTPTNE